MRKLGNGWRLVAAAASLLTVCGLGGALYAQNDPCIAPNNGTGTVTLPPRGCAYLTPQQVHAIIAGLPPGTTIELDPIHRGFFGLVVTAPGKLGGQQEEFESTLVFRLRGTGDLDGFDRILSIPANVVTATAPRTPGARVQSFDTEMVQLQGDLFGDPDFAELHVLVGAGLGGAPGQVPPLPPLVMSHGHTSLTDLGDGNFNVDSFFDVHYQIDFVGDPGGALGDIVGSTQGTVRMEARGERDPCVVDEATAPDGSPLGTVVLPPPGCEYLSPREVHRIIDGLPPGTQIELSPRHRAFFCPPPCGTPGGNLGGEVELFNSQLLLQVEGTGVLAGWRRTLRVPAGVETHTGPRNPGDPVQSFPTEMVNLQGQLFGDPDFTELHVVAGAGPPAAPNGLPPSPGHTSLTDLGDGTFQVDSFFDITYRIDFQGAPGSLLEGFGGSTELTTRMRAAAGNDDAVEPDDGRGTVTVPPEGSGYVSPGELHMILDGLPDGTSIEIDPKHWFFFCDPIPCGQPGGTLGGEVETFDSTLQLELTGTGSLADLRRTIAVPMMVETHTGPRFGPGPSGLAKNVAGPPPQSFDTEMFQLQGGLFGDPDFDFLTITGGTGNALPSPGHTTLTDLGDGTFQVDSFFDITYRIDFQGAPGGALEGMGGSTEGTTRVTATDQSTLAHNVTIKVDSRPDDATDVPFSGDFGSFSLDDDADLVLPVERTFFNLRPGIYTITETPPGGWIVLDIQCVDPGGGTTVDPAAGQAQIDLNLGEAITCTFSTGVELIFADGFESGNVSAWSSSVP